MLLRGNHGHFRSGKSIGDPLVLDSLSVSASAAYSLRKLRRSYTGSAVRVRRSSDNAEQDIGFVNDVLDTTSLLSFCGAGSGFVTTWYDQSTNGRNAIQSTSGNQPRIVSSGVVELKSSKPALRWTGTTISMPVFKFAAPGTNFIFNAVCSANTAASGSQNSVIGSDGQGYQTNGFYSHFTNVRVNINTNAPSLSYEANAGDYSMANGENLVVTGIHLAANTMSVARNGNLGTSATSGSWTVGNLSSFLLGQYPLIQATYSLLGTYSEHISFQGLLSTTDRQMLERNQGAFYGITIA